MKLLLLVIFSSLFSIYGHHVSAQNASVTRHQDFCFSKSIVIPNSGIQKQSFIVNISKKDVPKYSQKGNIKVLGGTYSITNYDSVYFSSDFPWVIFPEYVGELDTRIQTEIIIDIIDPVTKSNFDFTFDYQSENYSAKYFIKESESEDYFEVEKDSIPDFSPKNIKISFESTLDREKQEVIEVKDFRITRKSFGILIKKDSPNSDIRILADNTCIADHERENIRNILQNESFEIYSPIIQENQDYLLSQKDTDSDSISDLYDNCLTISNRDQLDVNQNGVGDACEFDSDSDGIPDEVDNCKNIANTDQADDDNDGVGDVCDNCSIYNPNQRDENDNRIGDICEQREKYIQENDDDSDEIINSQDNCKNIANTDQADDDNDGVGDVCDNCKIYQNPKQEDENKNGIGDICDDSDGDGIEGLRDNCPNIANQDQKDSDNDGVGDICEDDDRDEVLFSLDNCPYKYNPEQVDTDSDGQGDVCDETDNRFIESNKNFFIFLMLLITVAFMGGIFFLGKQIQKKS